jgi:hypothetical protein
MDRMQSVAAAGVRTDEQPQPAPVTWIGHVLVPLVQNLLGGVAVAALGAIAVQAVTGEVTTQAVTWCALVGGAVACTFTVLRFFGDDLGIVTGAYRAGRRSRDSQVAELQLQLRSAQEAIDAAGPMPSAQLAQRQQMAQKAHANAVLITKVAYQGDTISRKAMEDRGIGQRDWERAMSLLRAAGVLDAQGQLAPRLAPKQALEAIDRTVGNDMKQLGNSRFVPGWW